MSSIEGIQIHQVYGRKNRLKPGNPLSMLFMLKAVYSSVRFGMLGGLLILVIVLFSY